MQKSVFVAFQRFVVDSNLRIETHKFFFVVCLTLILDYNFAQKVIFFHNSTYRYKDLLGVLFLPHHLALIFLHHQLSHSL